MSDEENELPGPDLQKGMPFSLEIFTVLTREILDATRRINSTEERMEELRKLVLTLELGLNTVYDFATKEKERSDELEKKVKKLEKRLDNS